MSHESIEEFREVWRARDAAQDAMLAHITDGVVSPQQAREEFTWPDATPGDDPPGNAEYEQTIGGVLAPFAEGFKRFVRLDLTESEMVEFCGILNAVGKPTDNRPRLVLA